MPNHLHGIIVTSSTDDSRVEAAPSLSRGQPRDGRPGWDGRPEPRGGLGRRATTEPLGRPEPSGRPETSPASDGRGETTRLPRDWPETGQPQTGRPHRAAPTNHPSLFDIVDWFKTMTTNGYIRGIKENQWPPFDRHVWQRGYHDRIIRNDRELDGIRAYILANPSLWALDIDNPIHSAKSTSPRTIGDYLRDAHLL